MQKITKKIEKFTKTITYYRKSGQIFLKLAVVIENIVFCFYAAYVMLFMIYSINFIQ